MHISYCGYLCTCMLFLCNRSYSTIGRFLSNRQSYYGYLFGRDELFRQLDYKKADIQISLFSYPFLSIISERITLTETIIIGTNKVPD